jgi:hypothetical protein
MATPLVGFTTSRNLQTSKVKIQTFTYTGSDQSFTVPANVTEFYVYMWGAGGQGATDDTYTGYGGAGAMVQGVLPVTPGTTLTIQVGQGGTYATSNTYGGGGRAYNFGSAGGGASQIAISGISWVIAGGGGGIGAGLQGGCGTYSGSGASGEGLAEGGGRGGTQYAGGAGGTTAPDHGSAGSAGTGGDASVDTYAGGGGGGYYGGGGGGYGGGGGGSSFTDNLSLLPGEVTLGYNSPDSHTAPRTDSTYYVTGVAAGGYGAHPDSGGTGSEGGPGLIVLVYQPSYTTVPYYPFYPSMIGSNLIWFDADDPGVLFKAGTTVVSWQNKGTVSISERSNTGTVSAGLTVKNNRNVITFPGNSYLVSDSFSIPDSEKTAFMVYERPSYNYNSASFTFLRPYPSAGQQSSNPSEFYYFMNVLQNTNYYNDSIVTVIGGYDYSINATVNAYPNVLQLNSLIASGSTPGFWNAGSPTSFTSVYPQNYADSFQYFMGASNANVGKDLAEYLLFPVALGAVDRQSIEGYLAWKWGLQSNLPSSHPYSVYPPSAVVPYRVPGLIVWLDAADTTQYTPSGSNLTAWGNKGSAPGLVGGPFYANQFTFNSRPYVTTVNSSNMSNDITWSSPYRTFFCVSHVGNSNPSGYTAYWTASGFNLQVSDYQGTISLDYNGVNFIVGTTSQSNFYNNVSLVTATLCTAGNGIYINGISQTLAFNNSNLTLPTGAGAYPQRYGGGCDIGDMLIYDGDLSPTQRIQIEGYLAQKWGIASYLPITHPYSPNYGKSNIVTYSNAGSYIFTVPAGVSSINVYAWGAGGGASFSNPYRPGPYGGFGGCGALLMGTMTCTPGCNYGIVVGAGNSNGNYYMQGIAGDPTYIQYPYENQFFTNLHIIPGGGGGGGIDFTNNIEYAGGCGTIGNQAYSGGTTYQTQVLARTSAEIVTAGGDSNFGGGGNTLTGNAESDQGSGGGWGYHMGGIGLQTESAGYASGAGSSYYGSNLKLMRGEIQFGLESRSQEAPGASMPWYVYPAGRGGDKNTAGGNGLIVLIY